MFLLVFVYDRSECLIRHKSHSEILQFSRKIDHTRMHSNALCKVRNSVRETHTEYFRSPDGGQRSGEVEDFGADKIGLSSSIKFSTTNKQKHIYMLPAK